MKRIGYILSISAAIMVVFTIAMAQLESRTPPVTPTLASPDAAKHLLRVMSGKEIRGYYGSDAAGPAMWTGGRTLFAVSESGEANGPVRRGKVHFYDGLLSDAPTLTIEGPGEGDVFGKALSWGDWNGDGTQDLAVGAPGDRETAGKVYIYLGGASFGGNPSAMLTAAETGDDFGSALCMKDDINGDGIADLIVGAPLSAKSGATAGRSYIWFGRRDGVPTTAPDASIPLGTMNDLFGSSIVTGDINGDGQADLVIGSPQYNTQENTIPGGVFIFYGGSRFKAQQASKLLIGEATVFQDQFGKSVAIVEDVNADGIRDLVVGAPKVTSGGRQLGKVYLYHGGAEISSTPVATYWGTDEAGEFGNMVFSLGDINGDGRGDWAVQAPNAGQSRGVVSFYYGGWETDFFKFTGEMLADQLGNAVVNVGDWDGNGANEVIVGARWNDTEAENAGRIYVLSFQ